MLYELIEVELEDMFFLPELITADRLTYSCSLPHQHQSQALLLSSPLLSLNAQCWVNS